VKVPGVDLFEAAQDGNYDRLEAAGTSPATLRLALSAPLMVTAANTPT
jgi:hypothetical protein